MAGLRGEGKIRYVGHMFARIARGYDMFNTIITFGGDRKWRSLVADLAHCGEGGMALDVATGTGELVLELSLRGVKAVGIDFCLDMMAVACSKAERNGGGDRAAFVLGDALSLPFRDGSFDCATTGFALRNVVSVESLFSEMARVVRPGGKIVCIELTRPPSRWFSGLYGLYLGSIVPLVGRCVWRGLEAETYKYLPNSVAICSTAEETREIMERSGVRGVTYRYLNLGTVAVHVGTK
ncbi:MAG: ubiquinone/menaquinone biosynthesis methyltransferase [Chloroflexota bacterium]